MYTLIVCLCALAVLGWIWYERGDIPTLMVNIPMLVVYWCSMATVTALHLAVPFHRDDLSLLSIGTLGWVTLIPLTLGLCARLLCKMEPFKARGNIITLCTAAAAFTVVPLGVAHAVWILTA